jgi:hypothetical protein
MLQFLFCHRRARQAGATSALTVTTMLKGAMLMSAVAGGAAYAEPSEALDRFSISAGGFYTEPKIHAGADTRYGRIDTPDEKIDRVTLPRVKAELLFGDSQGLSFDYFRYDKSYDPSVSGQTASDGRTLTGTAAVDGNVRLDLAQLAYKWWIGHDRDVFGIGVGAAYMRAKVSGSATGSVTGLSGAPDVELNGHGEASASGYAPLLEFGWKHSFSPSVRMFADASGIKKNGGSLDGHIYGGAVGVEWFPVKNVGVVLDYGIQKIKLERNAERTADLDLRLTGPSAFVKVRF